MAFVIFSENYILSANSNLNRSNNTVQLMAEEIRDDPSTQSLNSSTSLHNYEETTVDVNSNNETITFAVQCLNFFNFYYLALIIFLGMVGNTLNFLVFTRTHLKLRSSSYYLAALALADLGYLLTPMVAWLNQVGIDLFNRLGFCQAMVYGSSVFSCLSVWLTVAYTFERLIAVQYPLQRSFMCTVHRAKIIIGVLTFVTFSVHVYSLFTAGITEDMSGNGRKMCDLKPDYYQLMYVVNMVDTVVTLVIPLVLIVVMNALIAKNLIVFNRSFKKYHNQQSPLSHQSIQMTTIRLSGDASEIRHHQQTVRRVMGHQLIGPLTVRDSTFDPSSTDCQESMTTSVFHAQPDDETEQQSRGNNSNTLMQQLPSIGGTVDEQNLDAIHLDPRQTQENLTSVNQSNNRTGSALVNDRLLQRNILSIKTQHSITKMLLLISTVFILLNLPSYVIRLQVFISDVIASSSSKSENSRSAWIAQQFSMLLYYTNFSINFLLYSACGSTFRQCLFRLLRDFYEPIWNGCCGRCWNLWRQRASAQAETSNC